MKWLRNNKVKKYAGAVNRVEEEISQEFSFIRIGVRFEPLVVERDNLAIFNTHSRQIIIAETANSKNFRFPGEWELQIATCNPEDIWRAQEK